MYGKLVNRFSEGDERAAEFMDPREKLSQAVDLMPIVPGEDKVLLADAGIQTIVRATGEIQVLNKQGETLLHLVPPS